jgi:hypothetical protein
MNELDDLCHYFSQALTVLAEYIAGGIVCVVCYVVQCNENKVC